MVFKTYPRHDITEILLKVALNSIPHQNLPRHDITEILLKVALNSIPHQNLQNRKDISILSQAEAAY
jgi:desulfoferrodoxin (superoxide reductase-like protein)